VFDQYIICDDSLRASDTDDHAYEIDVRMPYYRGLGLSMVEGVDLVVDGRPVPAGATTFRVHGNSYRMTDLPGVLDDRWEMGEPAQIGFTLDEPLARGDHQVAAAVRLRISYMPVPGGGRDTKTLVLA
jgi:hypothetical protein